MLFYAAREAIRNAARYGAQRRRARPLHLQVGVAWRDGLEITIEDDGVGMAAPRPPRTRAAAATAWRCTAR